MSKDRRHTSDEDADLVASWRSGELASFEALVGKYQKPMFNVAFRITGDYEDACQVVQDAFVDAYRNVASFRGGARFSIWLTAIIVGHSRNRLQREGKGAAALSAAVPPVPGEAARDEIHMQECIGALLSDFREVLVLRDLQDVPCREVGAILGIREATVKSRLCRAREMLTDRLTRVVGER